MKWRDRLPKAPLDAQAVKRQSNINNIDDWIRLFSGFQAELPEPFAGIDVLEGDGAEEACEALRALRRNPRFVRTDDSKTPARMWNINPAFQSIVEIADAGVALDLGCGAGRDAVWLAANGWEVTAVDRLEGNIETLKKLRAAYTPNHPIHDQLSNLNDYQPETQYDLVLLHYCWDPNYFELAKRCVSVGGHLSVLAHSVKHYECFGSLRETKTMKPSELNTDGFEIVVEREGWSIDRHFVSIVLRRC